MTKSLNSASQNAVDAVNEMIRRNFGECCRDFFTLSIEENENSHEDFYKINAHGGKINVAASCPTSLAYGVYCYLRKYCGVQLNHGASNLDVPKEPVLFEGEILKSTKMKLRYAYNYCTHSYTMAFWGEKEWQKELDFLAFHGVNLVLDITGEEKVWFEFFKKLGYSEEKALSHLVGPAYWAWFCMANMYGYGGILPKEYIERRAALAQKNHAFMARLGMAPVLMGYCGMVPDDIKSVDKSAKTIYQGKWNCFNRPAMLKTNKKTYKKYASLFYKTQKEVLGDITKYFSADPFHEGGNKGSLSNRTVAKSILKGIIDEDKNNVWIVQSWGNNPSKGLLKAVKHNKENALILDLYAEKKPHYKNFRGKEFNNTPWLYCMLDNFGGRIGLHGHIDTLQSEIPAAMNTAHFMKGVGITPEASDTNPLLTDFLFDCIWNNGGAKPVELESYISDYVFARYGTHSKNAEKCFAILCETVFANKFNQIGEGAAESIVNARPDFKIASASSWGNCKIEYDANKLKEAFEFLKADFERLKSRDIYLFDLTDINKQILSNDAFELHGEIVKAYDKKDIDAFDKLSDEFLSLILEIDALLCQRSEFNTQTWLDMAQNAAQGLGYEAEKMFKENAKKLITTWGDEIHANKGGLRDYSNRQWGGVTKELYYKRWKLWLDNRKHELRNEKTEKENFFDMENRWVHSN